MYQAPPPPSNKKPTPWALILLILGAGFVVVAGLCAFGGYMGYQAAVSTPQARKGFGKPQVLQYLDDGWARYRFPEVPLTADLPGTPESDKLTFETGSNIFTESWMYYGFDSELNSFELVGQWYRDKEYVDLKDETSYAEEWTKTAQSARDVELLDREATIGGLTGREVRGTCTTDGDKMVFRFFYWSHGKAVFVVHSYAWAEREKAASAEFERVVKSIQMK